MLPLTLLLDLDNTLLDTDMDSFLPAYYAALANHLSSRISPNTMLPALRSGVNKMLENRDGTQTLQQVFEADFYPQVGLPAEELRPAITDFYERVFPTLGRSTMPRPGAAELIAWAQGAGHLMAIATDPLFPRQATRARVRWAGLDPDQFSVISSFETFHFSKSHPAYFAEVLGRLGWPEQPAIMAGDDPVRDLRPAASLGLATFHVNGAQPAYGAQPAMADADERVTASGDLVALRSWLQTATHSALSSRGRSRDAILAMLMATPGVIQSLVRGLSPDQWAYEPSPADWAMIELICHLRDTEREVHAAQLRTMLQPGPPFVPRPDAAVWAKQRRYLREDGPAAVRSFGEARGDLLRSLDSVADELWSKPARHAIFGPTDFLEVVGFMAEHDRMHLQQAWATLKALESHPQQT